MTELTGTNDLAGLWKCFPVVGLAYELLDSVLSGRVQIFIWPSLQAVMTDSWVKINPESGSVWTRWTTTGESSGTSRMHGAGWRVPIGTTLSQWAEWLPALQVGDPPGGLRSGTTISSIYRSHSSNCVSCSAQAKRIKTQKASQNLDDHRRRKKKEDQRYTLLTQWMQHDWIPDLRNKTYT